MTTATAAMSRPGLPRLAAVELRKSADTRAGFWLLLVIALLAREAPHAAPVGRRPGHLDRPRRARHPAGDQRVVAAGGPDPVRARPPPRADHRRQDDRGRDPHARRRGRLRRVAAAGNAIHGGDWDLGLGEFGRYTLIELITMLGGLAFGLAFMNSALAIVMYFAIPIGWSILGETIAAPTSPPTGSTSAARWRSSRIPT